MHVEIEVMGKAKTLLGPSKDRNLLRGVPFSFDHKIKLTHKPTHIHTYMHACIHANKHMEVTI